MQLDGKRGILKKIAETIFALEAKVAKGWASAAHKRLFRAQWMLGPQPEWFDHDIDLYHQWADTGNSFWLERGAFGSLSLRGGNVLELACGDGFNAKYFYAHRSNSVVAVDFDRSAIKTAKKKNHASNITHILADIRTDMPNGYYENIIWDAAIEHFTPNEIHAILTNIKERMTKEGVLSGYTIVERVDGHKSLHQHEYEFKNMEDLKSFLSPYFKNVKVFETIYPSRHNLYFFASDSIIPFAPDWPHQC
jgi:SAM-dependent methyltransferase